MNIENQPSLPFVNAQLNFLAPLDSKPVLHMDPPADGSIAISTADYKWETVPIFNARPLLDSEAAPKLEREGFALKQHQSEVKDFYDDDQIQKLYYPEIVSLVKAATGATEVQVFDHTIRAPPSKGRREPVHRVHNDYTTKSAEQRVRDLTADPEQLATRLGNRYAFVNVWRPISETPVEELPLAVADARTTKLEHFVATDLVYSDRVGEIYYVNVHPEQRFYYFPSMHRGEVIFLKVYDSLDDGQTSRLVAHTAFRDPSSPPNPVPRESIEVRTIAYFGPSSPSN